MTESESSETGRPSRRLPRVVVLLSWVSLLADISGEMIYPLIPLFVVGVLGASATTLGGIEGAAAMVVAVITGWVGFRSDLTRKRVPYIRIGYGLPVAGKAMLALAGAWPIVLAGRLTDRLGKGLRSSPRDAMIADATTPEIRGRAFGFHRAMDTAGAMIGVLLAALLLWWLTGTPTGSHSSSGGASPAPGDMSSDGRAFRIIFAVSAALGLAAVALTFLVREPQAPSEASVSVPNAAIRSPTSRAGGPFGLPPSYWRTVAILLVFAFANSSDAFLLLRAHDLGLSPWMIVLAYALFNLVYTLASYPAGILSDRIGRWRVIAIGWTIYALAYAGFALTGAPEVWPLFALYGVYMALTDGVGKALVTDHAPRDKRGTALGVYAMASGLVALLASVVGGVLWDRVSPSATFGVGAIVAGVAVVLIPLLRPRIARAT